MIIFDTYDVSKSVIDEAGGIHHKDWILNEEKEKKFRDVCMAMDKLVSEGEPIFLETAVIEETAEIELKICGHAFEANEIMPELYDVMDMAKEMKIYDASKDDPNESKGNICIAFIFEGIWDKKE